MTIQSKINNSAYHDSEGHDTTSDPKSDSLIATHTSDGNERIITDLEITNRNSSHKLIFNRLIPKIIPGAIRPIDQPITEDGAGIEETLDALQTVISKEIVMDVAFSGARILWTSKEVSRTGRDGTTSRNRNTVVAAARSTYPVQICRSTTDPPSLNSNQEIINPIGPPLVLNGSGTPRNSKLL